MLCGRFLRLVRLLSAFRLWMGSICYWCSPDDCLLFSLGGGYPPSPPQFCKVFKAGELGPDLLFGAEFGARGLALSVRHAILTLIAVVVGEL